MKIDVVDGFKMLSDVTRKPTLIIESERLVDKFLRRCLTIFC